MSQKSKNDATILSKPNIRIGGTIETKRYSTQKQPIHMSTSLALMIFEYLIS